MARLDGGRFAGGRFATSRFSGGRFTRNAGGGGAGPEALFTHEFVNEAGSTTITDWPGLRVRINGGSWQTLTAAGLTISQTSPGVLDIAGFSAGQTVEIHLEQEQPGEPYSAIDTVATADTTGTSISAIYARAVSTDRPVCPQLYGLPLCPTPAATPVTA